MKKYIKKIAFINRMNSAVKGFIQHDKANRDLAKYRYFAEKNNLHTLNDSELKDALNQRLASRQIIITPKPKGSLNIFLAYYVSDWEGILPLTLSEFGTVTDFDWIKHGYHHCSSDWLSKRDHMNEEMLDAFYKANEESPIDIVIGYLSGYTVSPSVLKNMADAGAVIVNFCFDDKLNFPGKKKGGRFTSPAAIAHAVDLNLTSSVDSIIKYVVHGGLAMFWPEAAEPTIHKSYDLPFEYDVTFMGSCYGWRPAFIKKLKALGANIKCFGKGWPNGYLSNDDMIKIYSQSRINLGFAAIGHSKKLMCLKGRDFEVPSSGGLYLTQNNPELAHLYDIGREIVTYNNVKDCARIINELLNDHDKANTIRTAGQQRCLKDHTYSVRWTKLYKIIGLLTEDSHKNS